MKLPSLLFPLLLALPGVCLAELKGENLLLSPPEGYKVDFQAKQGNMIMTEMVPDGETVKNWTEMVTIQVFLGMKNATPEQFQTQVAKGWLAACKEGEVIPITDGEENGYAFSLWLQTCPLNPATGQPEYTWFKATQGNDSFYVTQKAFKFKPSNAQITQWMRYFQSVRVCDTRHADHPCPTLNEVGS